MTTPPTHMSRYNLSQIKDMAHLTIQALDEQYTVRDLQPHVTNGLLTEAEAWRIVAGVQIIKPKEV